MGSVVSGLPMAVLVIYTLPSPPQRQADRRVIVIKPVAEKVCVRVGMPVHYINLLLFLALYNQDEAPCQENISHALK
jgi:hypothetical protein